ncbi:MAG TPA: cation diffusion facilitator family transporter [Candidatus Dormibacteraeota bacterium]|jgi:cobalt-zinc-cadmium efflux system protein|nr:cation diffusion facilitator family transporter [Candidatus Dormibacteraeota bacterium]
MGPDLTLSSKATEQRLWFALCVSLLIVTVEFVGGLIGQSLALLGDSAHVLTDVLTVGIAIMTVRLGRKRHTPKRTFGLHRAEIFAALVNGSTLIAVAVVIIYQAYLRLLQPPRVQAPLVLTVAIFGLLGNLGTATLLAPGRKTSLNVRGAFLHALGDILSSTSVVASSLLIVLTGYNGIDPLVAALIGVLIIRSAYGLVRDSTSILLEATPKQFELEEIARTIQSVPGVRGIHDLHVWTITSGLYALSGHLTVESNTIGEGSVLVDKVAEKLKEAFGIEHVTLQMEKENLERIQREDTFL